MKEMSGAKESPLKKTVGRGGGVEEDSVYTLGGLAYLSASQRDKETSICEFRYNRPALQLLHLWHLESI